MDVSPFFLGRITEVLVTTTHEGGHGHAAPMGVRHDDGGYYIAVFSPSITSANARRTGRLAANFTCSPMTWVQATLGTLPQDDLEWPAAWGVPVLRGAHASVLFACLPASCRRLELQPLDVHHDAWPVAQVNRGFNALIEAAVLASRLELMETEAAEERMEELERLGLACGDREVAEAFDVLLGYVNL